MLDNQAELKPKEPVRLEKLKLLLVEGTHEVSFFNKLLRRLQITDVQVKPVGSKDGFGIELKNLSNLDRAEDLACIGLVRDADDNYERAFRGLQNALRGAGYPVPQAPMVRETIANLSTIIFVMPNNQDSGALEDLCLTSIDDEPLLACVDDYFACLSAIRNEVHPHLSKAKIQVYLAKERTGDCSFARAADWNVWNWESQAFANVRLFLSSL